MLAIAVTSHFDLVGSLLDFIRVAAGGILVGFALGWVIARLIERVDDYLIETTLTTVLAFGAYLAAERLHLSGVLAVVAAGLVNGNLGPRGMSPTTRIVLFNFWEYVAFLANSLVFLLIGLKVNIPALVQGWQPILWAIVAVLAARAVIVYGLSWISNRVAEPISASWQHVLTWGGLRGAICLALVLSLPGNLWQRPRIAAGHDIWRRALYTARAGYDHVPAHPPAQSGHPQRRAGPLRDGPCTSGLAARGRYAPRPDARRGTDLLARLGKAQALHRPAGRWRWRRPRVPPCAPIRPSRPRSWIPAGVNSCAAQRSSVLSLRRDGVISEDVFDTLTTEIDAQLAEGTVPLPGRRSNRHGVPRGHSSAQGRAPRANPSPNSSCLARRCSCRSRVAARSSSRAATSVCGPGTW